MRLIDSPVAPRSGQIDDQLTGKMTGRFWAEIWHGICVRRRSDSTQRRKERKGQHSLGQTAETAKKRQGYGKGARLRGRIL